MRPELAISVASIAAVAGSTFYLSKKYNTINAELSEIKTRAASAIAEAASVKAIIQGPGKGSLSYELNRQFLRINRRMETIETHISEALEDLTRQVSEACGKDLEYYPAPWDEIPPPRRKKNTTKKSGILKSSNRRTRDPSSDEEEEDEEDTPPPRRRSSTTGKNRKAKARFEEDDEDDAEEVDAEEVLRMTRS